MRILAVDDEAFVLELLVMVLRKSGHTVRSAVDGRAALNALQEETFDLVLTDLSMPDVDGLALAKVIKANNPMQKVVLLTGSRRSRELPPNIDYVLEKPLRIDGLMDFLQSVIT